MPYAIDLTLDDSSTLLGLVNHTNPETIGELLTFDKIDIQDFVKNIIEAKYKPTNIVVKDLADNTFHIFGNAAEVSAYYEADLTLVNNALAAQGPIVYQAPTVAGFANWKAELISHDTGVVSAATPVTFNESNSQLVPALTATVVNTYYRSRSDKIAPRDGLVAEISMKSTSASFGETGLGLSREADKLGLTVTFYYLNSSLAIIQVRVDGDAIGNVAMDNAFVNKVKSGGTFKLQLFIENGIVILKRDGLSELVIRESVFGPIGMSKVNNWLNGGDFHSQILRGSRVYNTSMIVQYATSKTIASAVSGWAGEVTLGSVSAYLAVQKNFDGLAIVAEPSVSHGTADGFNGFSSVKLINRAYPLDFTSVKYSRVSIDDLVTLPLHPTSELWSWYNSSEWVQERDIPLALQMFKDALTGEGVDADKALRNLNVTRTKGEDNYWYLNFTFDSYVLKDLEFSIFRMPGNFSDTVTVTDLNGFVYAPISSTAVIN